MDSVHSNAFNFLSFVQQGVDPRTGQYTVQLSLPDLLANDLAGPSLPLSLSFNPLNAVDRGFGLGFGLALSQYNSRTRILSLGSGESFKVTGSGLEPAIAERKLSSFRFFDDGGGNYRILHRTGLLETMISIGEGIALPVKIQGPSGHALKLSYVPFGDGQRLESMSDDQGRILLVERDVSGQWLELLLWPDRGEAGTEIARFTMRLDAMSRVTEIVLPTQESASWRFAYTEIRGLSCIKEVFTPVGGWETLQYEDGGHHFPPNAGRSPLPRVTRHRIEPGFGQPPIETRYRFSDHNFLGHGASIGWANDGLDNLYKLSDYSYVYGSTVELWSGGTMRRKVERTFNRFHLLSEETTTQDNCVKRVKTKYYADLPENIGLPFERQPPQCQLPASVETRWELTDDPTRLRVETVETTYDLHGNLLLQKNADRTSEERDYYPIQGEGQDCPPDPDGFVRNLRSSTVHPDPEAQAGGAPTLRTLYRYAQFTPLPDENARPFLLPVGETLLRVEVEAETEIRRSESTYFDDPAHPFSLARPRRQSQILNGKTTKTDYTYSKLNNPQFVGEPVLETVQTITGFDGTQQSVIQQSSFLNGQPLLAEDINQVRIRYVYDALQRVTSETISPGTDYEAIRSYQYGLVANTVASTNVKRSLSKIEQQLRVIESSVSAASGCDPKSIADIREAIAVNAEAQRLNGQAYRIMLDVKGVATHTYFDGISRAVVEERQDPGGSPNGCQLRKTYQASYDEMENIVEETIFDWIGESEMPLTTAYAYNSWGTPAATHHPDLIIDITEHSPFGGDGPEEHSYTSAGGKKGNLTVTSYNRFGKIAKIEKFDDEGNGVSCTEHLFDGLGRAVEQRVTLRDQGERKTAYLYDDFGRVVATTLPDETEVSRTFAEHTDDELPTEILVKPANEALPEIALGQQAYDGLSRLTKSTVGSRTEIIEYDEGRLQAARRHKPSGRTISFDYEPALGGAPAKITVPDGNMEYSYDKHSGQLVGCENRHGSRRYTYDYTGALKFESLSVPSGKKHEVFHSISRLGLQLERRDRDLNGPAFEASLCEYDSAGRLAVAKQGRLHASFEYESFGSPARIITNDVNSGKTLVTELLYDGFQREVVRTMQLGSQQVVLTQDWWDDNMLKGRSLKIGEESVLEEQFRYDLRGRLENHKCTGIQLPTDHLGNGISEQTFFYDAFDNVEECRTKLADGSIDRMVCKFANTDPCRLIALTHSHAAYPKEQTFAYDADGNMLNDEQGQQFAYSATGRLVEVSSPGRAITDRYLYDGHDDLSGFVSRDTETTRLYHGYQTVLETSERRSIQLFYGAEDPLGQQCAEKSTIFITEQNGSVIGVSHPDEMVSTGYSAYGQRRSDSDFDSLLGFNGETLEPMGFYLLGRGYRAYNPALMRFHSPDNMSPFGEGGINAYMYCGGNPVAFRDPSGHYRTPNDYYYPPKPIEEGGGGIGQWLGVIAAGVGLALSVAFVPWSAPATSAGFMLAMAGLGVQAAGLGLQIAGSQMNKGELITIGSIAGLVGGMGSMAGSVMNSRRVAQVAAAARGVNSAANTAAASAPANIAAGGGKVSSRLAMATDGAVTAGKKYKRFLGHLRFNRPARLDSGNIVALRHGQYPGIPHAHTSPVAVSAPRPYPPLDTLQRADDVLWSPLRFRLPRPIFNPGVRNAA
ncbi:hypothetical protein GA830_01710 [Mesorhizobium sp. NBSH29]|uniref:RHS repeat domain-containing protein n=1 Tax=Mesorhizobium sp. NBSH29 TaxID=2654249 RepID=UPI0018968D56|nr:RHS repeat-associated core domain-containing protein [Mesorhizobium sp. NBSH29]QPC85597.1 hypothetical protein GA830_01710 [Mesorhizobium sp. NBSH29]